MPDKGHMETEALLRALEKRIAAEYRKANREITRKVNAYMSEFKRKDKEWREKLENGDITEAEYKAWQTGQIMIGKRWEEMRHTLAQDYANTNDLAKQMAFDSMPDVYALNHNYATFEVEKDGKVDTSYTLYDRPTVERLIRDDPKFLPDPRPGSPLAQKLAKHKELRWEEQHVQSVVLQSVLQGESLEQTAKRFTQLTEMNYRQSVRYARTATTGAQNAGRVDGYKRAEKLGVNMKQEWLATLDSRTRHEHRVLDGQEVDVGEPFIMDGFKIKYPGDPAAPAHLLYNCRCTVIAKVKGVDFDVSDKTQRDDKIGDMSYEEWKEEKRKQDNAEPPAPKNEPKPEPKTEDKPVEVEVPAPFVLSDNVSSVMGENASEYTETIEKADKRVRTLYDNYSKNLEHLTYKRNGGSYNKAFNELIFDYNTEGDKFTTISHEFGHFFDNQIPRENYTTKELDVLNANVKLGSIDFFKACASSSDEFLTAMRKDRELNRKFMTDKEERDIIIAELKRSVASAGIQDAFDGWWSTQDKRLLTWGHGDKYYNREYGNVKKFKQDKQLQQAFKELGFDASNQAKVKRISRDYETASELWANVTAAKTCGGEQLEYMKKYMPNSLKAWEEICGKV